MHRNYRVFQRSFDLALSGYELEISLDKYWLQYSNNASYIVIGLTTPGNRV